MLKSLDFKSKLKNRPRPNLAPKVFRSYPYLTEYKNKKARFYGLSFRINSDKLRLKKAVDGFEPTIKLLQSRALPLGYTAITFIIIP